jgi:hypothetical protein
MGAELQQEQIKITPSGIKISFKLIAENIQYCKRSYHKN